MKHPEAPVAKINDVTTVFNKWNLIGVSLLMLAVINLPAVGSINDEINTRVGINGVRIYPLAADQAARPDSPVFRINEDITNHIEDVFDTLSRMSRNVEKIQQSAFGKLPTVAPKLQNIIVSTRNLQRIPKHRKIPSNYVLELKNDDKKLEKVVRAVSSPGPAPQGAKGTELSQLLEDVRVDVYNKANALEKSM
jgi:hypothetical protein